MLAEANTNEKLQGDIDKAAAEAVCPVLQADMGCQSPVTAGLSCSGHGDYCGQDVSEANAKAELQTGARLCLNCGLCDLAAPGRTHIAVGNMETIGRFYEAQSEAHSREENKLAHGFIESERARKRPMGRSRYNAGLFLAEKRGKGHGRPLALSYFSEEFKKLQQPKCKRRVLYFQGCSTEYYDIRVGAAVVKVMNANGYEVLLDKRLNCCGAPLQTEGYMEEYKAQVKSMARVIQEYAEKGIPVITSCPSCGHYLKNSAAGQNVFDVFEFLALLADHGMLKKGDLSSRRHYAYHAPCHTRIQGMGLLGYELLRSFGLSINNLAAGCCGRGITFGRHKANRELSQAIGSKIFKLAKAAEAEKIVCECDSCRQQLQEYAGVKTCHPIELLAKAYIKPALRK